MDGFADELEHIDPALGPSGCLLDEVEEHGALLVVGGSVGHGLVEERAHVEVGLEGEACLLKTSVQGAFEFWIGSWREFSVVFVLLFAGFFVLFFPAV